MLGFEAPDRADESRRDGGMNGAEVHVVHSIPGRVRLRVPGLSDAPEIATELRQQLGSVTALQSLEINTRSNSVVLQYEPTAQVAFTGSLRDVFPGIADLTARPSGGGVGRNPGREDPDPRPMPDLAESISAKFQKANEEVLRATGGIDLSLLVPLVLLVLSIVGFAAGAVRKGKLPLPSWYELLWFAFNTFVILNLTLARQREFREDTDGSDGMGAREPSARTTMQNPN